MMTEDFVPSTGLIRGAYVATICEKHDDERLIGAEFDRWLLTVQAAAWADGVEAAFNYDWAAGDGQPENPYTKPTSHEQETR